MKRFLPFLLALVAALPAMAQLTAERAFATAPQSVFPLIDVNTRLDMVDYYKANMAPRAKNALGGTSGVTEVTPRSLRVHMSDASDAQLFLLPAGSDTIVGLIRTVATPGHDSSIAFYTSAWQPVQQKKLISLPAMSDWVTDPSRLGDVETVVPFMLTGYDYNPDTATLTLTNNLSAFLSADIYSMVGAYMKPTMAYRWNGNRFTLEK